VGHQVSRRRKLREADRLPGEGKTIADVAKLLELS